MTFVIPEADASLEICWDNIGVPHIFATTIPDAFRGMGYACASERLWQLHLSNLYATGTAASVMGEKHIPQDLMHKAFNVAAKEVPDSPGDYIVDAYLQGVNAYVDSLDEVPAEFLMAGTEPRHYTRHDVASRYRFTGWFQHKTWLEKIYLGKLMAEHGVEYFRHHVLRFSNEDARCVESLRDALLGIDLNVAKLLFPHETRLNGSNNWAINGELSASGLPMLATDPHQPHSIPNTFFYSHLSAPNWDAFGASFPGVPYFMMGHNRDVSWGLTTGFVDTYDVFVESEVPDSHRRYTVDVASQPSRNFTVSESTHGPILESLTDALGFTDLRGVGSITALDWALRDQPTSAGILALMPLAKNSQQLGDALFENDVCPLVNNIICVDRHNDMHRYIATTLRHRSGSGENHAEHGVTGVVPLPGDNPDYHFRLSTSAELRVESNPLKQYTLTANNDTMGDSGSYPIHNFPTHDARAKRIEELLQKRGSNFTTAYFADMQLDLLDVRARELVPNILQSLKSQPQHESLELAIKLLSDWDYVTTIDSKAACIFYPLLEKRSHIQFMETVLGTSPLITTMTSIAPALNRFDISHFMAQGSPWRAHRGVLDKIIADHVIAIVEYLTSHYANDWAWGEIHQIQFGHSLRKHKPWQSMHVGPDPIAGSPTTLRMAQHNPPLKGSIKQEVYHGPAFRWIVDMADPLRFKFVIAGGNGGRPDSKHNSDHYAAWLKGDYFDMSLVRKEMHIVRQDKAVAMANTKGGRQLPEHVAENRRYWDDMADQWVAPGERGWKTDAPGWGCWNIPEARLKLLPDDMSGSRAIELGCGTAYVSCWLARRGAEVFAIDNSEKQLATARRLAAEHALAITFHHGNAEATPYPDQHFDFAISEYGAAIWCDPTVWIPEAHRILKPGGELVFLGNSPLSMICTPADGSDTDDRLHRSYFDLGRLDWTNAAEDPGGIEFNMSVSSWMRLFRETGFEVLDYLELQVPRGSSDQFGTPGSWAENWPAEQVWKLRRNDL